MCPSGNVEDVLRRQTSSVCWEVFFFFLVGCWKSFVLLLSGEGDAGCRDGTQCSGGAGVVSEPES